MWPRENCANFPLRKENNLCASENAASPLVTYPSLLCSPNTSPAKCLSAGSKPCGNTPKGIKRAETCLSSSWLAIWFPLLWIFVCLFSAQDRSLLLTVKEKSLMTFVPRIQVGGQGMWAAAVKSTVWCTLGKRISNMRCLIVEQKFPWKQNLCFVHLSPPTVSGSALSIYVSSFSLLTLISNLQVQNHHYPTAIHIKNPPPLDFRGDSMVQNLPANAGDTGSIPGLGRSPGEENGNPF